MSETKTVNTKRGARRAGRNRPDILRSAGQVIADRGYEETRFADVAERSGASVSTLQYLFGSRDDLLIATLRQTVDEFFAAARDAGAAESEPLARLRATLRSMMAAEESDEDARRDWAVWIEYWRAASRDPELGEEAERTYAAWTGLVADAIAPLVGAQDDVNALAAATTAMVDGFGIQIVLGPTRLDRAAAAETVLAWLAAVMGRSDLVQI
ncbi:MAG TPA: TetR/AcrR family transcriptional regulator [Actinomycetes bacterium]|nr:TetR/AcrR family transcriptional regulator [Actinomycetes bacterium]